MVFLFGKTANSETICYDIKKTSLAKSARLVFYLSFIMIT
ncbi:hypothetical protein SAMN02910409_0930 [Prevotellaceae bacterium HUN156]|nr:hypothetical protein SAMN02910409_0930 [Prevotellaceae bacterium HUN156]